MHAKLRIGIIAHVKYAIAEPFAGGLEMHTHALASKLHERGHHVTLFASESSSVACQLHCLCFETGNQSVADAYCLEHDVYTRVMATLAEQQFDIVHNNSLHYLPPLWAADIPAPMLTTLHTPPFDPLTSSLTVEATTSGVVAVSEAVSQMWSDTIAVSDVVHNGIDLRKFSFRRVPSAEPYVVWSGRLVPEKGLPLAVAAAQHAGFEIRIAGPVVDVDYYEAFVAPLLGKRVKYVGHLRHTALAQLVAGARAFVASPLWDEPYGLVVAEAIACGVPVAAFCRGAMPEILDQSSGVMATPDSVRSLGDAIGQAVRLDRSACRRRAESFCNIENMIDGYERIYRKMLRRQRDKPALHKRSSVAATIGDPIETGEGDKLLC